MKEPASAVIIFLSSIYLVNTNNITAFSNSTSVLETVNEKERIIGGEAALNGDLKYQLSIRLNRFHHCGASLVQLDGVQVGLTAAHCTESFQPEDFAIVAGDIRLSDRSGKEQIRRITKIVNHEEYDPDTISFDIAILFLDKPFVINEWVAPIPLPEQGQDTKGTAVVSGWGVYSKDGIYSDNLTKLEVPIVDDDLCRQAYAPLEYEFFDHFICAGYLGIAVNKDSCKGDSGGPLRSVPGGYLAGIVSWSEGCAHPSFPGVNTEVSYFVDWVTEEVSKYAIERNEADNNKKHDISVIKAKQGSDVVMKLRDEPTVNNGVIPVKKLRVHNAK